VPSKKVEQSCRFSEFRRRRCGHVTWISWSCIPLNLRHWHVYIVSSDVLCHSVCHLVLLCASMSSIGQVVCTACATQHIWLFTTPKCMGSIASRDMSWRDATNGIWAYSNHIHIDERVLAGGRACMDCSHENWIELYNNNNNNTQFI